VIKTTALNCVKMTSAAAVAAAASLFPFDGESGGIIWVKFGQRGIEYFVERLTGNDADDGHFAHKVTI
jgi:hypothetical protein